MGESSERAEGRGRAGLNREVLRVQRTARPTRSTGLASVHSLRRHWETDRKLFLLALRVEARLASSSHSCFTKLARILRPSGPVPSGKSRQFPQLRSNAGLRQAEPREATNATLHRHAQRGQPTPRGNRRNPERHRSIAFARRTARPAQSSRYQYEWMILLLRHSQSLLKGTRSACPSNRATFAPLL